MSFIFSGITIQSETPAIEESNQKEFENDSFASDQSTFTIKKRTTFDMDRKDEFEHFFPSAKYLGGNDYFSKDLIVKGYITDNTTDLPIDSAVVFSTSLLIRFTRSLDTTFTNIDGYYEIAVNARYGHKITARFEGYYSEYDFFYVDKPGILWMNFSLMPNKPMENSTFTINLYDNVTDFPISDALVIIDSKILSDHFDMNYSYLDLNPTNIIHCNNGAHRFFIYSDGYFPFYSDEFVINENQEKNIDFYIQPIPEENASITGIVKDFETDQPIQHATILLFWGEYPHSYPFEYQNYTRSNDTGIYEINAAPGKLRLYAYADDYFYGFSNTIQLVNNEKRYHNFTLYKIPNDTAEISGYILDNETGEVIENAKITMEWTNGHGNYLDNTTTANEQGYYQIHVPAGNINFQVDADGYFRLHSQNYMIFENESRVIDLKLDPLPEENSLIFGFIKDRKTNEIIPNAEMNMYWSDEQNRYYFNETESNSNGYYEMNIAAGSFWLSIRKDGYFSNFTNDFTIGENEVKNIDIYLDPEPEVTSVIYGYVRDINTNQTISGAEIDYTWYRSEDNWHSGFIWNYTTTDDNGFYMMNVPAGLFRLWAEKDGYFTEISEKLTLGEFEAVQIDILLYPTADETAVISGFILDEKTNEPIHNATVGIRWNDDHNHFYRNETTSDVNGYYEINVAAGRIDFDIYKDGYFSIHGSDGQYEINEYDEISLNFSLYPEPVDSAIIKGRVTNEITDDPINDAKVYVDWEDSYGHSYLNTTKTNASGEYSINVPAGVLQIRVGKNGYYTTYTDNFIINQSEMLNKDIVLYPEPIENSVVKGYVIDSSTNQPLSDVDIHLTWNDDLDHYNYNSTDTNEEGFYQFNVAEGSIHLIAKIADFYRESAEDITISEGETLTINFTLDKKLNETATVYGYVKDEETGMPIKAADIHIYWRDLKDHYDSNHTETDSQGFYSINVAPGIINIGSGRSDYFYDDVDEITIEDYSSIQIDFILGKKPVENVIIVGYIIDDETKNPINDVHVYMSYKSGSGHSYRNSTFSNEDGFYEMYVPEGKINLNYHKSGYEYHEILDIQTQSYAKHWENISLTRDPFSVIIINPLPGIYINNRIIFQRFFKTLIIGEIEIEAYTSLESTKVEFYIDGFLKKTDTTSPYTYQWTRRYFFFHKHIIKVKAYDDMGNTDIDRMIVKKYF